MLSAIAIALVVVLVALIARELGAGHAGQAVAALATAASGIAMALGHLLSTTTFDLLVWVTVVFPRSVRILGGGDERQWLLVGLAVGIGLENEHLVLLLLAALACGCLVARRGRSGTQLLVMGRGRAGPRSLDAQPPLAGTERVATAGARPRDRRRGSNRITEPCCFPCSCC